MLYVVTSTIPLDTTNVLCEVVLIVTNDVMFLRLLVMGEVNIVTFFYRSYSRSMY